MEMTYGKDLVISADDRIENIRRAGEMNKPFLEAGVIALTVFISSLYWILITFRRTSGSFRELHCCMRAGMSEQKWRNDRRTQNARNMVLKTCTSRKLSGLRRDSTFNSSDEDLK